MNVCLSGYTAVGKTTHASLLASELGYKYASASEYLMNRLEIDPAADASKLWHTEYRQLAERLKSTTIDAELDAHLAKLSQDRSDVVFDARFLPWVDGARTLRIWLDSDLLSRARKCAVSLGLQEKHLAQTATEVQQRDLMDIDRLLLGHEHVFSPSRDRFDAILDNGILIRTATRDSADAGIAAFAPYVQATFSALNGDVNPVLELLSSDPYAPSIVRYVRGLPDQRWSLA